MAIARTHTLALVGTEGFVLDVESAITNGTPGLYLVGLADRRTREIRDRVRAGMYNSGLPLPNRHITVTLAPGSLPKQGTSLDLAIAVSVLAAMEVVPPDACAGRVFVGELGLDGALHAVRGALPAVRAAVAAGHRTVVVPRANSAEVQLVPGATIQPADTLREVVAMLHGHSVPDAVAPSTAPAGAPHRDLRNSCPPERSSQPEPPTEAAAPSGRREPGMSAFTPVELLVLRTLQDHHCRSRAQVINEATRADPTANKRTVAAAFDQLHTRCLIRWEGRGRPGQDTGYYRAL
ncbi:magnesium chelatase domain-containing protein [Actinomadura kijaniata]|uniref:magnesium chelatase domain-containing protein n=1 Tax=Actinomadura kijaniata TaxID=46161 RepID=UPI0008296246|nr:magnesium chelatase domain-containing protein [Actinomadura kijaniata]